MTLITPIFSVQSVNPWQSVIQTLRMALATGPMGPTLAITGKFTVRKILRFNPWLLKIPRASVKREARLWVYYQLNREI